MTPEAKRAAELTCSDERLWPSAAVSIESAYAELRRQRDMLLEALQVVEWPIAGNCRCQCCGRHEKYGHNEVCRVGLALAACEPAKEPA